MTLVVDDKKKKKKKKKSRLHIVIIEVALNPNKEIYSLGSRV